MTEKEDIVDDVRYIYIKLNNGDNILCATKEVVDDISENKFIAVIDPIQIFSVKVPYKGLLVEKFMMQSWVPFADSDIVNIPLQHIIFIGDLKEPFMTKYIEYVNAKALSDSFGEEADDEILSKLSDINTPDDLEDLDEDDLELEDFIDQQSEQQPTKKWLH